MAVLQATVRFPGIAQVESASVTLSHGITPSISRLTIAPQRADLEVDGDLTLEFDNQKITLKKVHLDSSTFQFNESGQLISLNLMDRRWKWKHGEISGHYNLRHDDNTVKERTKKKPQELAKLCLEAMGEKRFSVKNLPNDSYPTVEWEGTNPAEALADLCDDLGCRVVLKLNDSVHIERAGQGKKMPNGPIIDGQATINPADRPDSITVLCGRTRYQADLLLEAVGMDTDGKIRLIDQLSYKPFPGGWGDYDPPHFHNLADKSARELCKNTVFRWYRIKEDDISIPGCNVNIERLEQILPIEDRQVIEVTVLGVKRSRPAQVYGIWFRKADGETGNTASSPLVPLGNEDDKTVLTNFSIDAARGIVQFSEPVYQQSNGTCSEATLRLRTAVSVRDKDTLAWERHRRKRDSKLKKFGTKTRIIKKDEIALTKYPEYLLGFSNFSVTDNEKDVNAECDYYLNAAEAEYRTEDPANATYAGWWEYDPDGAIQVVEWTLGGNGAFTRISRNQDLGSVTTIPYKLRRKAEQTRKIRQVETVLKPTQLRLEISKAAKDN